MPAKMGLMSDKIGGILAILLSCILSHHLGVSQQETTFQLQHEEAVVVQEISSQEGVTGHSELPSFSSTIPVVGKSYEPPIVMEKFKLIFFTIPFVGSSTFMQLFRRMEGHKDWKDLDAFVPHHPDFNGLTYLSDYTTEEARRMMESDDWIRAVFVRDPKERALAAYREKVAPTTYFEEQCCKSSADSDCATRVSTFMGFLESIPQCIDRHWIPQSWRVGGNNWPFVDFVGHWDHVSDDVKALLTHIGAWDEYGKSGWGQDGEEPIFYEKELTRHDVSNNGYLSAEIDLYMEELYDDDYNHPMLGFRKTMSMIPQEAQRRLVETDKDTGVEIRPEEFARSGRPSEDPIALKKSSNLVINADDTIMRKGAWDLSPIVVEEYKLIFFSIPKVACTVFKKLFRRMKGIEDWDTGEMHDPKSNGLTYLSSYSVEDAKKMLESDQWIKAMFVREPKIRLLSAFLNKVVGHGGSYVVKHCCREKGACLEVASNFENFLKVIQVCPNAHWNPLSWRIEGKYWPYIDFIGHSETIKEDSKRLLEKIGAWKKFGTDGWGLDKNDRIFPDDHAPIANTLLEHYYTPEIAEKADEYLDEDYGNPFLGYEKTSIAELIKSNEAEASEKKNPEDLGIESKGTCGPSIIEPIPAQKPSHIFVIPDHHIYSRHWDSAPVVLKEYKLIFFTIPQVVCTTLKQLFRRMMGLKDWDVVNSVLPHDPAANGLKYLYDYSVDEASSFIMSDEWTKAIFVRDPKERALGAYLSRGVKGSGGEFRLACCKESGQCVNRARESFYHFMQLASHCCASVWGPQTFRMEGRYWPFINFVGYAERAAEDAHLLLKKLGAWEKFGKSGWSKSQDGAIFDEGLEKILHAQAKSRMGEFYTEKTEKMAEKIYAVDYANPILNLKNSKVMVDKSSVGNSNRRLSEHTLSYPETLDGPSEETSMASVNSLQRKLVHRGHRESETSDDQDTQEENKKLPYGVETPNTGHFGRTTDEMVATEKFYKLEIDKNDCIYSKRNWDGAPVVLEQSKLIFFTQRRVASKTFKRLFRRIIGFKDWKTADVDDPKTNGLKYLYDYSIEEAETMMTSDKWTRAIFVRDPKERVLSAFLDLAMSNNGDFVRTRCCNKEGICAQVARSSFGMFLNVIGVCENPHWNPQTWRMEGRYWAYIDFVGHLENAPEDGKKLLQDIGAWDEYGATGWGQSGNDPIFPFGYEAAASKHRSEYYIAEMELAVEDRYKEDYDNPFLGYERAPSDDPEPENAEEEGGTEAEKKEEERQREKEQEQKKEEEVEEEKDVFGVETPHTGEYGRTTYEPVALERSDPLIVNEEDCIYRKGHLDEPGVVVEKFRLIFFTQPGVGAETFKRLLRRMMGFSDWKSARGGRTSDPSKNGLKFLYDYSIDEVQEMMMSEQWTKALFVRDPKQRIIEVYLRTAIPGQGQNIRSRCCEKEGKCAALASSSFEGFLKVASVCQDPHWIPQSWMMEGRYWAYMDVVGHIETAADDVKLLLERIGAWKEFGSDGWGKNGDEAIFVSGGDVRDVSSMVPGFYSNHLHEMAEMIYAEDYNNPYMRYSTDGSIEEFIGSTEDNFDDENLGVEVVVDCGAVLDPDAELDVKPDTLVIDKDDYIYKKGHWDAAPVVVEEFKLVFFTISQIAASTFKQLFRRMMGFSDWHESNGDIPHNPKKNGLKYLYDYSLEEAVDILESDEWTKAIFARDPKERALATYLTVIKGGGKVVREACCKETGACVDRAMSSFKGFLEIAEKCCSPKWMPQTHRMKSQAWPFINFVGDIDHASRDMRNLLDKVGAWDEFGSDGWGKNGDESIFESASGGDIAKAKMAMGEYYTEETEDMVERMFADDYKNPHLPFEPTHVMTQGDADDEGRRLGKTGPGVEKSQ